MTSNTDVQSASGARRSQWFLERVPIGLSQHTIRRRVKEQELQQPLADVIGGRIVAGFRPGAHEQRLGNSILAHLAEIDGEDHRAEVCGETDPAGPHRRNERELPAKPRLDEHHLVRDPVLVPAFDIEVDAGDPWICLQLEGKELAKDLLRNRLLVVLPIPGPTSWSRRGDDCMATRCGQKEDRGGERARARTSPVATKCCMHRRSPRSIGDRVVPSTRRNRDPSDPTPERGPDGRRRMTEGIVPASSREVQSLTLTRLCNSVSGRYLGATLGKVGPRRRVL